VVGSTRGMAVPTNSPNGDAAKEFVKFLVSQPAQQLSLENMGGVVRSDLNTSSITPSLKPFVDPETKLVTDDFLSAKFPWFLELREAYYKKLIGAISNPPQDWNAWIAETADAMREEVARLKQKS
jgi:multiple sugar transport system substrate-binding protein